MNRRSITSSSSRIYTSTSTNADAAAVLKEVVERVLHEPDLPGGRAEIRVVGERDEVGGVLLLDGLLERLLIVAVDGRDEEDFVLQ